MDPLVHGYWSEALHRQQQKENWEAQKARDRKRATKPKERREKVAQILRGREAVIKKQFWPIALAKNGFIL